MKSYFLTVAIFDLKNNILSAISHNENAKKAAKILIFFSLAKLYDLRRCLFPSKKTVFSKFSQQFKEI